MSINIAEYPGKWLLGLSLLSKSCFANFPEKLSNSTPACPHRLLQGLAHMSTTMKTEVVFGEMTARCLAETVVVYLKTYKDDELTLSALSP